MRTSGASLGVFKHCEHQVTAKWGREMHKFKFISLLSLLGCAVIPQNTWAADVPQSASASGNCYYAGIVEGSGLFDLHNYPSATAGADTSSSYTGANGYGFLDISCGLWNAQANAGIQNQFPYSYNSGAFGYTHNDLYGKGGADVFLRNPNSYAFGVGIEREAEDYHSVGFGTATGVDVHAYGNWLKGRAFGEAYINNHTTLGALGYYRGGDSFYTGNGYDSQDTEYGGDIYAKYYVTPNISMKLDGALSQRAFQNIGFTENTTFYSATLSGEYKFNHSPVSLYSGLRYGGSSASATNSAIVTPVNYAEGYVGITLALGPYANGSLVDQDRHGAIIH